MEAPTEFRLKADVLKQLSVKSDAEGAARALCHFGAIALCAAALWESLGSWLAIPLTLLLGYLIAFLFTAEHETAHQTAFRTRLWNYIVGHICGFAILLPYEYYRSFHWDHHRYTQDPDRDPELAIPLPTSRIGLALYIAGLRTWRDRFGLLLQHGIGGRVTAPWVQPERRAIIMREARAYLIGYAVVILASIVARSWAAVFLWVIPVVVGQLFLRPYLMAEHTGCAYSPDMLENTRTTYTNPFVRFFAWNMPYHAEHHACPSVPFHALPRLNAHLAPSIVNCERGYPASLAAVLRFLSARMRSQRGAGNPA